jgi:hypothetical protein
VPEYISGTEGAGTMRWFQKTRRLDVWEIADDQPLGDIEAASRIREICASAGTIAERMTASGGHKAIRKSEKEGGGNDRAVEAERYQAAIKRALEIAMKIADDQMRDVAVSQVIRLCVKVDHLKTARVLIRAIHSEQTQAELMADNPVLRGN